MLFTTSILKKAAAYAAQLLSCFPRYMLATCRLADTTSGKTTFWKIWIHLGLYVILHVGNHLPPRDSICTYV